MGLIQVTPPAFEPLTIAEVSAQLRLDATNQEPAPGALACALASPAAPGSVTNGAHRYLVTFVTADGETQAGTESAVVTVVDAATNGQVKLTGIPVGSSLVTARKLYRTQAAGTVFLLLATIANNTATTYTDNLADGSLGAGAPSANTTGDPFLLSLIQTARDYAETFTRKRFVTQSWKLTLDSFPPAYIDAFRAPQLQMQGGPVAMVGSPINLEWIRWNGIELPNPPLQSVTSITYLDTTGVLQTMDPSAYRVDLNGERGIVTPAFGTSWPSAYQVPGAIAVTFVCGFGAPSAVSPKIKHALKMLVSHWYSHRELFVTQRFALEIPMAVDALLWADRALDAA
jgi:hypothetical protein